MKKLWEPIIFFVVLSLPLFITTPYYMRVMIFAGIFIVLAISYDLIVGQVGALSLAHPAFYGIGAYAVGVLVTKAGWGFPAAFLAAAFIPALTAIAIGIPSFRLEESTFAIGTLGFLMVLRLVATNWIEVTDGPMCITGIPPLAFSLPAGIQFTTVNLRAAFYGIVFIATMSYIVIRAINSSRVGRAFHAVRENKLLASVQGVNTLFYKMLAFVIGAAIAGVAGGYYASWSSLVCPSELELWYVVTLLIIINLGGAGSLRGVMTAAVIFTVLPEILRISPSLRLVIYGVILLIFAINLPSGIEGLFKAGENFFEKKLKKTKPTLPRVEEE